MLVGLIFGFGLVLNVRCLALYGRGLDGITVFGIGYLGIVFGLLLITSLVWFGLILCLTTLYDFCRLIDWCMRRCLLWLL